jgi:succinate dehydrogenase/fumarate reductase flavoprotein subunit
VDFSKINESQEPIAAELRFLLAEAAESLEKVLGKSQDEAILQLLSRNVGKYVEVIAKLLEENASFLRNLNFLQENARKMQELSAELQKKLISKVNA